MKPLAVIEGGFGEGTLEEFLADFWFASRGEYEPMQKWGVNLTARGIQEEMRADPTVTLPKIVARQLRRLEQ